MEHKAPKCKLCPYGLAKKIAGLGRYDCRHPFCRKRKNLFGRRVPIVCPIVDPMSPALDLLASTPVAKLAQSGLFDQDAALGRRQEMQKLKGQIARKGFASAHKSNTQPSKQAQKVTATVAQTVTAIKPEFAVRAEAYKSGFSMTYDDAVAAAGTVQEMLDWEQDANTQLMGQLFDAICVFCFSIVAGLLAGFLPSLVPVPATYIRYLEFTAGAVKIVALVAIVAQVIRHALFLHRLQVEREKIELALAVALTKSKYTRGNLDAEARKRRLRAG